MTDKRTHEERYILLIYAVLALATIIAYEPVRHNEFVNYDDNVYVTENPQVKVGITPKSIVWAFTTLHATNWHPLTWLSHMLDCQLFGLNPLWHHLTNLAFHIANTLLLFWILRRMTGAVWPSAFVAAAFALHPLHVESVAWVAERKDVLSALFWMLTIAAYIRYAEKQSIGRFLLVFFVFGFGLMAKPMLVTLPFVLLLLDYWPLSRFQRGRQTKGETLSQSSVDVGGRETSILQLIFEKVPLFVLVVISCAITYIAQQKGGAVAEVAYVPLNLRIANAFVSYIRYIGKMIYPSRLAVLYPHPVNRIPLWQPIVCLLILVVVSAVVIYAVRRRRYLAVGWLWYLGTLVPAIGLVQVGEQAMADRYTYLPSIGVFILVGWGAGELLTRWHYREIRIGIMAGVVLTGLLISTRIQVRHWQNSLTLYGHAIKATENNYVMHNHYAYSLWERGEIDEALAYFNEALRINPRYSMAHYNMGQVLSQQGKFSEAIKKWETALEFKPGYPEAHYSLGQCMVQQGKHAEAIRHFKEALRLKPDYPDAINNLGFVLKQQGKVSEAIKQWKKVLEFNPGHPHANSNMGLAMEQLGIDDKAIKHFKEALESKPDWPEVYCRLGSIYHRQGKYDLAVKQCTEAVRLKPDYLSAHFQLAHSLVELGQIQSALDQHYKILSIKPNHVANLNALAWILATTEDTKIQNSTDAVKFAERACELANYEYPGMLDTLAAAHASAGNFSEAVKSGEKAINLAVSQGKKALAEEIRSRLRLYKAKKPYYKKRY